LERFGRKPGLDGSAGARQLVETYQRDPVRLGPSALAEALGHWTPDSVAMLGRELDKAATALEDFDYANYLFMLKADVKPTMSKSPVHEIPAPQTIAYNEKIGNLAVAIYKVAVRRFESLLAPEVFVNLQKDLASMAKFIQASHPWGEKGIQFLENDFSKYDKAQLQFAFELEFYIMQQLGVDEDFLVQWHAGHTKCTLRSQLMTFKLVVMYQRKSGDATTAFGNVLLNMVSVAWAYRGVDFSWIVFQGDDSLAAARSIAMTDEAVNTLAAVFNLTAKCFVVDSPYITSSFLNLNHDTKTATLLPDPIKRIEKFSQAVEKREADRFDDKFRSASENCAGYMHKARTTRLVQMVADRYAVSDSSVLAGLVDSLATAVSSYKRFRAMWNEHIDIYFP